MKLSLLSEGEPGKVNEPGVWQAKTQPRQAKTQPRQAKTQPDIKSTKKPKQNLNLGPGGNLEIWFDEDDEEKPNPELEKEFGKATAAELAKMARMQGKWDPERHKAGFGMGDPAIAKFMKRAADLYNQTGKPTYILDHGNDNFSSGRFLATTNKPLDKAGQYDPSRVVHIFGDPEYKNRPIV